MPNITAEQRGRELVLAVQGVDREFVVVPLPARRGKHLTEQFIRASLGRLSIESSEAVFVEALGPGVYSALAALYVDEFDESGAYVTTHGPDAAAPREALAGRHCEPADLRFGTRDPLGDEPALEALPIRQEEVEALALAAFYWQTVVGMDGVSAFIAEGAGQAGSLKTLALLQIRLGLSRPNGSSPTGTGSQTQRGGSEATNDTASSYASAQPPAERQNRRTRRMLARRRD